MGKALSLELEILRDVFGAVLAGRRVVEIAVGLDVWQRLQAERPQSAYLFEPDEAEPCRAFLGSTPVRPDAGTARWRVITAEAVGISPAPTILS
jgi:hypothetical protein